MANKLIDHERWKRLAKRTDAGYYELKTEDTGDIPVRLFLTHDLLLEAEDILYRQIVNATRFPGVKLVVITPDTHYGYGVPVGCVILTDATDGAVAMGPVGFDIGCFTGDTLIPGIDGRSYPLEELARSGEPIFVYSISPDQRVRVAQATAKKTRSNAALVKVTLDNGREIFCTPDHEFMLRNGEYCAAIALEPNASLMPLDAPEERTETSRNGAQIPTPEGSKGIAVGRRGRAQRAVARPAGTRSNERSTADAVAPTARMGPRRGPIPFPWPVRGSSDGSLRSPSPTHGYSLRPLRGRDLSAIAASFRPLLRRAQFESLETQVSHDWGGPRVRSIEALDRRADVYCLTVPEYGNFALDAGVFVHNCGMVSARSEVPAEAATPDRRLEFNRAVMERIEMGAGGSSRALGSVSKSDFDELVRGGAEHYVETYGASFDRSRAERHRIPVDDDWQIPWGGRGRPERGLDQLGSLGGGNHFIELQRSEQTGTLFVQVHTGSRGFGHGLATNYFDLARAERPEETKEIDLGYFTPDSPNYRAYLNAVAAGGNFAILNRLVIYEQIAKAFRKVFRADLDLVYEISHNLVQREQHPEFGDVFVHRKGATRAFPAGHPALAGTLWEETGHPVLIPGSNMDYSYILRPRAGAVASGYSVNHGAGRRLSRGDAVRQLSQARIDRQYKEAGILVNTDGRVPLDEAAPCYKSAEEVVRAVTDAGLARIEHRLWPLSSLKGTDGGGRRRAKADRKSKPRSSDHY